MSRPIVRQSVADKTIEDLRHRPDLIDPFRLKRAIDQFHQAVEVRPDDDAVFSLPSCPVCGTFVRVGQTYCSPAHANVGFEQGVEDNRQAAGNAVAAFEKKVGRA